MSLPAFVDLLKLIVRDVEVLELGALDGGELLEGIARDVEPLQVHGHVIRDEERQVVDLVFREVQVDQVRQRLQGGRVLDVVHAKVAGEHLLGLFNCLVKGLNVFTRHVEVSEVERLAVVAHLDVRKEACDDARLDDKFFVGHYNLFKKL